MEGDYAPNRVAAAAKALGHVQKFLTSDNAAAFSISDISAIAVASSVADPRASFVYVPELSHVDAKAMLESIMAGAVTKGSSCDVDVDISALVTRVGGNPAVLQRLWESPSRVEAEERASYVEIKRLIRRHPAHKQALFELAKRPYDEGMKQEEFDELSTGTLDSREISQQYRVFHINLQNVHVLFHEFTSFRMTQALLREEEADTETS